MRGKKKGCPRGKGGGKGRKPRSAAEREKTLENRSVAQRRFKMGKKRGKDAPGQSPGRRILFSRPQKEKRGSLEAPTPRKEKKKKRDGPM